MINKAGKMGRTPFKQPFGNDGRTKRLANSQLNKCVGILRFARSHELNRNLHVKLSINTQDINEVALPVVKK